MFLTSIDNKSDYDRVRLSRESWQYFGIEFAGWYFVYTVLPFGFKLTDCTQATGYCRKLGVPCLQYIDDRLIAEWVGSDIRKGSPVLAWKSLYIVCQTGIFIGLAKCSFIPSQLLKFLGLLIDTCNLANDDRPIHLKEADALITTISSLFDDLKNYRVDAFVDNKALVDAWNNLVSKNSDLNDALKKLFELSQKCNIDLKVQYIATKDNPADKVSRSLSLQDCQLSEEKWNLIQRKYDPHTVDLMALDSNVMLGIDGKKLKHFTPFPSPLSDGVNLFSQDLRDETYRYVFPPFGLISPV
ncbi:hypothetical protein KUTeg_019004 [Tegillarca granosa]|uniref:RNase H type-1 domain-containing protein n=1 Tax=Tegillarca granosa TaxID=220873 RepID=A0ABQ9EH80_TEGGR|nr:hypothetical protein KUTeg_019004 [Tegillarca granosa]